MAKLKKTNLKKLEDKFLEHFGENTSNFMGSGLSVVDFFRTGMAERMEKSFTMQLESERRRRVFFIMELSAELARIKKKTNFSISLAEHVIEDVIDGDWSAVATWIDYFDFEHEVEATREVQIPIWADFVKLLEEVVISRDASEEATN